MYVVGLNLYQHMKCSLENMQDKSLVYRIVIYSDHLINFLSF
jgi:hypothetical protein